jgi:hypothetical protein
LDHKVFKETDLSLRSKAIYYDLEILTRLQKGTRKRKDKRMTTTEGQQEFLFIRIMAFSGTYPRLWHQWLEVENIGNWKSQQEVDEKSVDGGSVTRKQT